LFDGTWCFGASNRHSTRSNHNKGVDCGLSRLTRVYLLLLWGSSAVGVSWSSSADLLVFVIVGCLHPLISIFFPSRQLLPFRSQGIQAARAVLLLACMLVRECIIIRRERMSSFFWIVFFDDKIDAKITVSFKFVCS
jgi:hypothetical protein